MAEGIWAEDQGAAAFALPGDAAAEERAIRNRPQAAPEEPPVEPETEEAPPEVTLEEETATEEPQPSDTPLIGGKFRSVDDVLAAYQDVEREKGRLAREIGELRQLQELPDPLPQVNHDAFSRLKEENPALAMQQAVQSGDQNLISEAAQAWEEVSPGAPLLFAQNYTLQQQLLAVQQSMEARTQPLEAQRASAELSQAYMEVRASFPDFDERAAAMQRVAEENPELVSALREGSYEAKVRVLKNLYAGTLLTGPALPDNQEAAKAAARADSQRAKSEAQVVSATASVSEAKPTAAEQIGAQWAALDQPFKTGWLDS